MGDSDSLAPLINFVIQVQADHPSLELVQSSCDTSVYWLAWRRLASRLHGNKAFTRFERSTANPPSHSHLYRFREATEASLMQRGACGSLCALSSIVTSSSVREHEQLPK